MATNLSVDDWSVSELEDLFGITHATCAEDVSSGIHRFLSSLDVNHSMDVEAKMAYRGFAARASEKILTRFAFGGSSSEDDLEEDACDSPPPPTTTTYVASFKPDGLVNQLKRESVFQTYHFNSMFRPEYYATPPTDYQYTLPFDLRQVISLQLESIDLPLDALLQFSCKKRNHRLAIITHEPNHCTPDPDDTTEGVHLIEIAEGDYTAASLVAYLNCEHLCLHPDPQAGPLTYLKFFVDARARRIRLGFANPENVPPGFSFELKLTDLYEGCGDDNPMRSAGWIMGFRLPHYKSRDGEVQAEAPFDPCPDPYYFLSIDDYQFTSNVRNVVGFDESNFCPSILAKIPIQCSPCCPAPCTPYPCAPYPVSCTDTSGCTASYACDPCNQAVVHPKSIDLAALAANPPRVYNGPVRINKLHVRLFDKFGDIVHLFSRDFAFALRAEILMAPVPAYKCPPDS